MNKTFILFLVIAIPLIVSGQNGDVMRHRQLTMGKDTSELYLCTYWFPYSYNSVYEIIMHSNDNGLSFSLRNNRFCIVYPGSPSALFGDSTSGVVYECPDHAPDTFSVSIDTGMTLIHKYFHHPFQPATGCLPGEIYFQTYTSVSVLWRSVNYGSSFDTIIMADSLELVDVGVNPGELYFEGYGTHTMINIVTSSNYGLTCESHKITVPYYLFYDLRRGALPGEFYLLLYDSPFEDYFYIYHVTDYGNTVTYQQKHEGCGGYFAAYTAGRKPGTFYVARRSTYTPDLYIDYSTDYGVTFTTYTHYLDNNYTGIVIRNDRFNIIVYPNPGSTKFNIDLPKDNDYIILQILNLYGQVCLQQEITSCSEKVVFDVANLSKGIYVVRLKTKDNKSLIKKVIVN